MFWESVFDKDLFLDIFFLSHQKIRPPAETQKHVATAATFATRAGQPSHGQYKPTNRNVERQNFVGKWQNAMEVKRSEGRQENNDYHRTDNISQFLAGPLSPSSPDELDPFVKNGLRSVKGCSMFEHLVWALSVAHLAAVVCLGSWLDPSVSKAMKWECEGGTSGG